ncbi:alpha/beta hydrolase [Actinomadura kijaniata]|uniref:alpha/beta hydrolase n=1 Tax=Actinomadura kijaniata TaxID=46161 RepID=UPI003F1E0617
MAAAVAAVTLGYLAVPTHAAVPAAPPAALPATLSAALPAAPPAALPAVQAASGIRWKPCPKHDPLEKGVLAGLECGTLRVPLDHAAPSGKKITLALTRARATDRRHYKGVVLLNRGGPGAHGRDLPRLFRTGLPRKVAAAYDWIGYDPRGVGASRPAIVCDRTYQDPGRPRPDTVPADDGAENAWAERARRFAADCATRHRSLLPHMGTVAWARDLEAIRIALRQKKINYFGYSYGSYLGAVYATMYPRRVGRMVLDSVVRPSGVWYDNNLDQNVAFEKRIQAFFEWIARNHGTYRLGETGREVAASYARVRRTLADRPVNGRIGPVELDDLFLADGYGEHTWASHARALSAYLVGNDPRPLAAAWRPPTWLDHNNYAVYTAVECRDAAWPRDWDRWHADNWRLHNSGYRFETWGNAWYNAPCAFWAVPGGPPPRVRGRAGLPPVLLVQGSEDAATPYAGAVETHRLLPGSRLLEQRGGGNHGVALSGDRCVDEAVADYLAGRRLPRDQPGADMVCTAPPPPGPGEGHRGAPDGDRRVTEPVNTTGSRTT